jgi:anhydro-N-acetylmuramic acid kinase
MLVMGYMSGTSLDGVDVAVLETDGERIDAFGSSAMIAFSAAERAALEKATRDALAWEGLGEEPLSFGLAAEVIEAAHLRAGRHVIERLGRLPDLVGFHGQTLLHRPERKLSVQIGDPQVIADGLGVSVVAQMRQDDLLAGGQGAPLVPAYHAALAEKIGLGGPMAFLNLGGVANLTWIGADGALMACDTGPGNGLIDQIVQAHGAGRYDDGGRIAAAGTVDRAVLADLLSHPHFRGEGPKSLDRYDFPLEWAEACSLEDAAATLTAFTAEAVAVTARFLPQAPKVWVICGGGSHNPTLMKALCERLGDCRTADEVGLRSDFVEAEAMAFLAARSLRGLPLTFPGTTGVSRPLTGGTILRPETACAELV